MALGAALIPENVRENISDGLETREIWYSRFACLCNI